jgi:hypothetical protein
VPLNTASTCATRCSGWYADPPGAVLAYQNLQGSAPFKAAANQDEAVEIHALQASLTMMQSVLNDVLDMNSPLCYVL